MKRRSDITEDGNKRSVIALPDGLSDGGPRHFHPSLKFRRASVSNTVAAILVMLVVAGCASSRPQQVSPEPSGPSSIADDHAEEVANEVAAPPAAALEVSVESYLLTSMEPWSATPHRFGGMNISGADCSGFIVSLYRDIFGISLPRSTRDQVNAGRSISRGDLAAGDLVFFRPDRVVNHVGVYLSEGRFAHISTSRGFIVSHLDEPYWARRHVESRRVLDSRTVDAALLAWNAEDAWTAPYEPVRPTHDPATVVKPDQTISPATIAHPPTKTTSPAPERRRGGW